MTKKLALQDAHVAGRSRHFLLLLLLLLLMMMMMMIMM